MSVVAAALLGFVVMKPAAADDYDKLTKLTFNAPVEIPGMVLAPGTYTFKLMDSESDRHIVQVFNADQTHLYATILAIPVLRLNPTDRTVVKFKEASKDSPEAIREWFYPGDDYGQEFVYPESRAVELAKTSNEPVKSMPSSLEANIKTPARSSSEPSVMAMKQAPVKTIQPAPEIAEVTPPVTVQQSEALPAPAPARAATKLPKTASSVPLAALIGLLSLGAAVSVRVAAKLLA